MPKHPGNPIGWTMPRRESLTLLIGVVLYSVGIIAAALHAPHAAALVLRCAGVLALLLFAGLRRSVSVWIFIAMIAGAELGFDAPKFAVQLRFLSDIFLRLIQCVVAPLIFAVCVLLPVVLLFRIPLMRFLRAVAEPATIAFATSTSQAALPSAMERMEAFGVPRRIVAFVIPAGYSFNLDGSTLYLAVASIFVAQAAGMHLTLGQQLVMMFTLMLTSKGVAGVPRSMLVVLMATASTFHLPVEPIFVLLGVDTIMDMARTLINVVGNCLASAAVAKWEHDFGTEEPSPAALEAAMD